jgi:uncharacterized protein (DUF1778 family)
MTTRPHGRPIRARVVASEYLNIRLTADEKRRIYEVAALNGLPPTVFVRQAIEEAVSDCIEEGLFDPVRLAAVTRKDQPMRS